MYVRTTHASIIQIFLFFHSYYNDEDNNYLFVYFQTTYEINGGRRGE